MMLNTAKPNLIPGPQNGILSPEDNSQYNAQGELGISEWTTQEPEY